MPPTSLAAQYIMWGMLILLVIIMVAFYFHVKNLPVRDDVDEEDEANCPHCGETLEDHAENIAKKAMSDPNHTPYN